VNQVIVIRTRRVNHAFHLIAFMLTCGLWTPVWVLCWLLGRETKVVQSASQ
jgi:hypothetical protein